MPDYPTRPLTMIAPGMYRVSTVAAYATINRRDGRKWEVGIRSQSDGRLLRCGGIWPSLRTAHDEANFILRWEA